MENLLTKFVVILGGGWPVGSTQFFAFKTEHVGFPKVDQGDPVSIEGKVEAGGKTKAGLSTFTSTDTFPEKELRKDEKSLERSVDGHFIFVGHSSLPGN